ncbi:hypothetical protein JKI95_04585 [Corynebacterium aquatimens]|uniref:hypothetical protein n=1 Tax=Corynebacterium TaxID=1716 RepID=UPI001F1F0BC4|nr:MULTISPECIES: hypothetical protein [Corynebacterium]QYH20209.1 hypothetical protein JKI95_04585 [Corynebacterium aquatimens]UIZ92533.1 hypothetical protein JZY91_01615 [Corynebacterium sp. CNCTC7651]
MFPSDIRNRPTPVPTPLAVRLGGSLGAALSVAIMVSQVPLTAKVPIALLAVAFTIALSLAHPYRAEMRNYARRKGVEAEFKVPSISMLLPLMGWWLLLMLAPLAHWPVWGVVLTFVGVLAAAWVLFPHVDGSRRLAYAR